MADRHGHLLRLLLELTEPDPGKPVAPPVVEFEDCDVCGADVDPTETQGIAATCQWWACPAKGRKVFPGDLPRVIRQDKPRRPASG